GDVGERVHAFRVVEMTAVVEVMRVKRKATESIEEWSHHAGESVFQSNVVTSFAEPVVRPKLLRLNCFCMPNNAAEVLAVRFDGDECKTIFAIRPKPNVAIVPTFKSEVADQSASPG